MTDEPLYLPITVPVHSIVTCALREINEGEGCDRDEAYLLARLERVPEEERTAALLKAIEEACE